MRWLSQLRELGKLRGCHMLATADMRPALLMLGSGHLLRSEHMPGQRDLRHRIVQCHRCHLRWSGLVPRCLDLPRDRNVRHKYMSWRSDLSRLVLLPRLCDMLR